MTSELETAGLLSIGGFFRRHKSEELLPLGTPCPNCSTALAGPWCHVCGQHAEDFHRSAAKLVFESFREFLDFDNRLWRTVPDLILRPGRLTRSYLDGHRAPQVPPLRLFLVILLGLFLIGLSRSPKIVPSSPLPTTQAERAAAIKEIENNKDIEPQDKKEIIESLRARNGGLINDSKNVNVQWWIAKINYAKTHQSEFWQAIQNWAERFAILVLPMSALLLSLLFIFQRRFFLFDHVVFSMHSLSFNACCCPRRSCSIATRRSKWTAFPCWPRPYTCSPICVVSTTRAFGARSSGCSCCFWEQLSVASFS